MWDGLMIEAGEFDAWDDVITGENEAGILEFIIPAAIADQQRRMGGGGKLPAPPRRYSPPQRNQRGGLGKLGNATSDLQRQVRDLSNRLDALQRTPGFTTGPDTDDIRTLAGTQLAVAAPGAGGFSPWGTLTIVMGRASDVSHLVIEVAEDMTAATIPQSPPFVVTGLQLATTNALVASSPAIPGSIFGVSGANYGWPLRGGPTVPLPAGTSAAIQGSWNPRTAAGASAATISASFLRANMR